MLKTFLPLFFSIVVLCCVRCFAIVSRNCRLPNASVLNKGANPDMVNFDRRRPMMNELQYNLEFLNSVCCIESSRKISLNKLNLLKINHFWFSTHEFIEFKLRISGLKRGDTRSWTTDLSICSRLLYHWAISPTTIACFTTFYIPYFNLETTGCRSNE